jgi:hypothetical protein
MNCRKVRSYLYGYYRNELAPVEAEKIKAHLVECAECARELEKVAEVSTLLKNNLEVLVPSPDFTDKLLARIQNLSPEVKESKKQTWWQKLLHETFPSLRLRWAAAGAVSVIVLALVISMFSQKRFFQESETIVSDNTMTQNQNPTGSSQKEGWSIDKIFEQAGKNSSVNDKSFVIENLSTASLDRVFDSTNWGEDGRFTPVDLNRRFIMERSTYQNLSRGNHYILPVVSAQPAAKKTDY